jgi:hypothetical protein
MPLVRLSLALYTTPYVPSPTRSIFSYCTHPTHTVRQPACTLPSD